jgi:hypothetical protein
MKKENKTPRIRDVNINFCLSLYIVPLMKTMIGINIMDSLTSKSKRPYSKLDE